MCPYEQFEKLIVKYKEHSTNELTLDKEYETCGKQSKGYYYIINDTGNEMSYPKNWFIIVTK